MEERENNRGPDYYLNRPSPVMPEDVTTTILRSARPMEFHRSLPFYAPTPLVALPGLARKYGVGSIFVKDESSRFGLNAFKGLGAIFAINEFLAREPSLTTFCTATDGNHGRAVAWAARHFRRKAHVFVPAGTARQRILAIGNEGATVKEVEGDYDDTCRYAARMADENGWRLVQDTAWEGYEEIPAYITAGYLTLFEEIDESLREMGDPQVDIVFLQAGVGSFAAAGIAHYIKRGDKPLPKIVIVEPIEADAFVASFREGVLTTSSGNAATIMAGLNCGTPSLGAWNIIKSGATASLRIADSYARRAIRELYYPVEADQRIISGESGSAGLAAFLAVIHEERLQPLREALRIDAGSNLLFVSTEGATDQEMFNSIISV